MKSILMLSVLFVVTWALADDTINFRNDDRPTFDRRVSVSDLESLRDEADVTVLDVRLIENFEADPLMIPGASYKNPDEIAQWAGSLPDDGKIVVYCVRGKWVSQKAATILERKGYDVYSLEGGIEAWKQEAN